MNTSGDPIAARFEAYRAAVLDKDVEAFVALYDRGVRTFDLGAAWSYDGIDALRAMVAEWFGSLGAERVEVAFSDARGIVAADIATVHCFATFRAIAADGTALRTMDNRLTWTLRPTADGWKIVHEHTSAPVDPEAGRAILAR